MTKKEFLEKYPIKFDNFLEELVFFELLDKVYTGFTAQQAVELMADFYANADNIFNSIQEEREQAIEEMKKILEDAFEEPNKDFDA